MKGKSITYALTLTFATLLAITSSASFCAKKENRATVGGHEIYTPRPKPQPRINGPLVYGCRPGNPFLYRIPCQGKRPINFSAEGLPKGLSLDPATGIINGTNPPLGEYMVTLKAKNAVGRAERQFKIVAGETLALPPPDGLEYTFMEPHDIPGLIKLMEGPEKFTEKLVTCFDSSYFVMGNEPDMAYPYLFNYVKGEEWRTQKQVREMIYKNFSNAPDGLPGNDDCGTTSACLLFAMMGFYPACPGDMDFQLASPVFDKITIALDPLFYSGKEFIVEARNAGKDNCYIKSMELNGKPYRKYTLNHHDIVKGGKLSFVLQQDKK